MQTKLSELIEYDLGDFEHDPDIIGITLNSKEVKPGYLFIALKGKEYDGADFIDDAMKNGAVAILMENVDKAPEDPKIITIVVDDARKRYAEMARRLFPNQPEILVAVTGTNGKTSTVHQLKQIWNLLHYKAASIGTLGVYVDDEKIAEPDSGLNTPEPMVLHKTLDELDAKAVEHVVMEASSHGLAQHRMDAVRVRAAGFTNFTQDHLDYHGSMEEYFKAKLRLFTEVMPEDSVAVLNADIPEFEQLKTACAKHGHRVISFGRNGSELKIVNIEHFPDHQIIDVKIFGTDYKFQINLRGEFQIYNVLCAVGLAVACGAEIDKVVGVVENLQPAPGRMEKVIKAGSNKNVYVDYAHTPDALEKAIKTVREALSGTSGKLFLIFGCGGDRDKNKRPIMGKIAAENADKVFVTDDNPRREDPESIRMDIRAACPNSVEVSDRSVAIKTAIGMLGADDILLIAGKGHETYQIYGSDTIHFDDVEVAKDNM